MKIKDGFMLMPFADQWVAVSESAGPAGNVVISLNGLGAFLWDELQEECGFEELLRKVLAAYCVEEAIARKDLEKFICSLETAGILMR